jgi:hypothetical protein
MRLMFCIVILTALTIIMLSQSFLMSENVACITDRIFEVTTPINNFFASNILAKHILMIVCGLFMDIMVITTFLRFCFHGTSWRLIIALVSFYGFRALIQVKLTFVP